MTNQAAITAAHIDYALLRQSPSKLARLNAMVEDAICAGEETLTFEGYEMNTQYAMYVVQYLRGAFGGRQAE